MTATTTTTTTVRLRYFAAAAEAAGTPAEDLALPVGASAADLRHALTDRHGDALGRVLAVSSLLVDEVVREDATLPLAEGGDVVRVDVLPPFAGG